MGILAVIAAAGCGGEDAATTSPATEPTTVPTATVQPVSTSTVVPESTISSGVIDLLEPLKNPNLALLPFRELPAGLDPDLVTEQPTEERVIELWTEYLSDSIVPLGFVDGPDIPTMHLCRNGTVVSATGKNPGRLWLDTPEKWLVDRNAGMSS